jgi:16S rRNA (uracil1498-N3)-methyltransferase
MNLPLFYQHNLDLQSPVFDLDEDASRHVIQVLRMQKGEKIQLTDGKGSMLIAEIEEGHKKSCTVKKISLEHKSPSERKITIAISPVKNTSRFEWFLEKATEMGVHAIIPLICKRTEKQHFRKDRMQSILTSAMLQSKQAFLPLLLEPTSFSEVFALSDQKIKCIAHCEDGKEKNPFRSFCTNEELIILVGPEGDFTTEEIEMAINQNFIPVSLGATRLRTETAGVAAAALFCI